MNNFNGEHVFAKQAYREEIIAERSPARTQKYHPCGGYH
jgi:hypothetical protein